MNDRAQSDEDVTLAFAVVACLFAVAVVSVYVVPAIVLGILLALGVMALTPTRR